MYEKPEDASHNQCSLQTPHGEHPWRQYSYAEIGPGMFEPGKYDVYRCAGIPDESQKVRAYNPVTETK